MDSGTSDTVGDSQQNTPCDHLFHGYAGFWKRLAAIIIDMVILCVAIACPIILVRVFVYRADSEILELLLEWIYLLMFWLYFVCFECSSFQATPGKMMVGIKVTDMNGNRISFARASGRFFGKFLSNLLFSVGFLMAAFTRKKQGLHDIIAGCLVVNKNVPTRAQNTTAIVAGLTIPVTAILSVAIFPAISNAVFFAQTNAMAARARDIYVNIEATKTPCEPVVPVSVWPKSGEKMEAADDIDIFQMTFANSSDYFTVLYDIENYSTPHIWAPYVHGGFDYSKFAGAGVPKSPSRSKRLKAKNNAWTIAANITDEMPDIIPIIISRNVDPDSLIPREGDLRQQFVRPSEAFKTPFGNKGFVIVRKGGAVRMYTWRYANLHEIYRGASEGELQEIRDAFQTIKYLTP